MSPHQFPGRFARALVPEPMPDDILREQEGSAERVLAEHVDHLAPHLARDAALVPTFPEAQRGESLPFYRHRIQAEMRTWVRFAFSDLVTFPGEEAMAQRMATGFAVAELGRTLGYFEQRQLVAAVRDVLTCRWLELAVKREDKIRGEEWLADQREGES